MSNYVNARISKPVSSSSSSSRRSVAPRSTVDDFQVGTVSPSYDTFVRVAKTPKWRDRNSDAHLSSMKSAVQITRPEIYQMTPSIVPFSLLQAGSNQATTSEVPATTTHVRSDERRQSTNAAGTTVELPKQKPLASHVGATVRVKYLTDIVDETQLKQTALLTLGNLPTLIDKLKEDIADITTARKSIRTSPRKKSSPRKSKDDEESAPFLDFDRLEDLNKLANQKLKAEGLLIHFDAMSGRKVGARDLAALKADNLVDSTVESIFQRDAHALVSAEIARLQREIDSLS